MRNIAHSVVFSLCIALTLIVGIPQESEAQVNKKKVLREASGIYKGTRSGGIAVFASGGMTTSTVVPPTYRGKFKYPVSRPKPVVRLSSSQLPNGTALYKGRRTKGQVKRNGSLIAYVAKGTGDENDGYLYTNAVTKGSISKKGRKWRTNLKMSAFQDQGGGNTKTVSGMTVKAVH